MRTLNCSQKILSSFRKHEVGSFTAAMLLSLVAFLPSLCAQQEGGSNSPALPVTVFGGGERPRMNYSGEQTPQNVLLVTTGYEASYDDNPLSERAGAQSDEEQSVGTQLALVHQSARLTANFNYQPYFQFYRRYSQFNRFNQTFSADGLFTFNPHFAVRLRDDFLDQTGLYAPSSSELSPAGIGTPTAQNATIYTPLNNEQANTSRADIVIQKSSRTSLDLFGGYATRTFSQGATSPFGTTTQNMGGEYVWRANEHASVGLLGVYERIDLNGSLLPGSASRLQSGTLLPTVGWKLRPTIEFSLFAGPQAIRQFDLQDSSSKRIALPVEIDWEAGGGLVVDGKRIGLMVSAQRTVTDGGGVLSFVTNNSVSGGFRKRLHGGWDFNVECGLARNSWIPLNASTAWLTEESVRAVLVHPLHGSTVLHFEYEYLDQTPGGDLNVGSSFHRNRVATNVAWNWRAIRLGH